MAQNDNKTDLAAGVARTTLGNTTDLGQMRRLYALHAKLASEGDLSRALDEILAVAVDFAGTDRGILQLVSDDGERLEIFAHRGYSRDSHLIAYFRHHGSKAAGDAARSLRATYMIEDFATDPALAGTIDREIALAEGVRATLHTPMITRSGKLVGVLNAQFRQSHRATDDQLRMFELLAWTAADIIERHRVTEALRAADARLRAMADAAPVLIWETDASGVTFLNRYYLDFFGVPFKAVCEMGWAAFIHPDDAAAYQAAWRDAFDHRRSYSFDCRFRRADGKYRWLRNIGEPLGDDRMVGCSLDITDQKLAAEDLRESEERFRALADRYRVTIEAAEDIAIFTIDPHGQITSWPTGAARIFGFTAEDAIGKPVDILYVPRELDAGQPLRELVTAEENGVARDVGWHVRKDGSQVFVDGSLRPLRDSAGRLTGFLKVAQDMTERRRVEQRLRESEERLRLFVANVREYALVTTDRTGRIMSWNPGAERLFGYSTDEVIGRNISEFLTLEDRAAHVMEDELAKVTTGQRHEDARWMIRKNGSRFWARWVSEPIRQPSGELRGVARLLRDETDRMLAEDALRRSEASLRTTLASLSDAVIACDAEARVTYMNTVAEKLTGWSQDEAVGKQIEQVYVLATLQGETVLECQLRRALARNEPIPRRRFALHSRDGRTIAIDDAASPILDGERLLGAVTVFNDITDQVRAEQQHARERDRLEQEVEVTTAALGSTRADLRHLLRRLMVAQEDERRHVAKELHDDFGQRTALLEFAVERLRQEVGPVQNGASDLLETLRAQVRDLSQRLREASHRLHPSALQNLGLGPALGMLVDEHRRVGQDVSYSEHGIPVTLASETTTALYRIAQEALHNAAKHAPDAPVHVFARCTDAVLELKVEDAGPGFDMHSVRGRGGLGLLSMQERAESVGGTLATEATPGEGTTITVRVPIE